MKIKVFRFRVSNWASHALKNDIGTTSYEEALSEIDDETTIENVVNDFIKDKTDVSIIVTPVEVSHHNNARGNTVDLVYTISYKETA